MPLPCGRAVRGHRWRVAAVAVVGDDGPGGRAWLIGGRLSGHDATVHLRMSLETISPTLWTFSKCGLCENRMCVRICMCALAQERGEAIRDVFLANQLAAQKLVQSLLAALFGLQCAVIDNRPKFYSQFRSVVAVL